MNIEKEITHLKYRHYLVLFLVVMCIGGLVNVLAIALNGGRMPVLTDERLISEEYHFPFTDKNEVKGFYYTDLIPFFGHSYWSFGDALIIFGVIMNIIYSVKLLRLKDKGKKKKQNLFKRVLVKIKEYKNG